MGKKWADYLVLLMIFSSFIFSLSLASMKVFFLLVIISSFLYGILKPLEIFGIRYWRLIFRITNPLSKEAKFYWHYGLAKTILSDIKQKKFSASLEDRYLRLIEREIERMRQIDADSSLIKEIVNELYDIGKTEDLSSEKDTPLSSEIRKIDTELKEMDKVFKKETETKVRFKDILFGLLILFLIIIIPLAIYLIAVKLSN